MSTLIPNVEELREPCREILHSIWFNGNHTSSFMLWSARERIGTVRLGQLFKRVSDALKEQGLAAGLSEARDGFC